MEWVTWTIIGCLIIALVGCMFYAIKFALIILRMQDAIEESLDIMDQRYASISNILQRPLFYDSPEIKRVLKDIEQSREAILYVANIMTSTNLQEIEVPEGDTGDISLT